MLMNENTTINDKEFIRTYSSLGYMIERDGIKYAEALDLAYLNRTYTETTEPIEDEGEAATAEMREKAKAYDIITGVDE